MVSESISCHIARGLAAAPLVALLPPLAGRGEALDEPAVSVCGKIEEVEPLALPYRLGRERFADTEINFYRNGDTWAGGPPGPGEEVNDYAFYRRLRFLETAAASAWTATSEPTTRRVAAW
jgi:hypothetical protein